MYKNYVKHPSITIKLSFLTSHDATSSLLCLKLDMCHFYYLLIFSIWALITLSYVCVCGSLQNVTHLVRFRLGFSLFPDTKQSPLFLICSSSHAGHVFLSLLPLLCVGPLMNILLRKAQPQIFKPSSFFTYVLKPKRTHCASFFVFFRQSMASNAFSLHSIVG